MSNSFHLDTLPDLPQIAYLHQLVPILWQRPDMLALWLEGSFGRGNADLYSDVDLHVGVTAETHGSWRTLDVASLFGDLYAAHHFSDFAEDFIVYHVYLTTGVIYDLHIQPRTRTLPSTTRLILACDDTSYRADLLAAAPAIPEASNPIFDPKPLNPAEVRPLLVQFWINADKGRKVLYRRQDLTVYTGLHLFRHMLIRLLFMEHTGTDCGDLTRPTIHGLKAAAAVLGDALGDELGLLMGMPARTRHEMWQVQDRLHREVARVGRGLAHKYHFDYPTDLEQVIMENWARFEVEV